VFEVFEPRSGWMRMLEHLRRVDLEDGIWRAGSGGWWYTWSALPGSRGLVEWQWVSGNGMITDGYPDGEVQDEVGKVGGWDASWRAMLYFGDAVQLYGMRCDQDGKWSMDGDFNCPRLHTSYSCAMPMTPEM